MSPFTEMETFYKGESELVSLRSKSAVPKF